MRFSLIVLAALAVFFAPNFLRADLFGGAEALETVEERPRLVAATFRSSWCGACRVIEPRIEDVQDEYEEAGAAIDFLRFDFTLGRRDGLRDRAEAAGIVELFDQLEGRTGFMVIMDRETGDVTEIVTMRYSRQNIREALERGLAFVRMAEQDEARAASR